MLGTGARGAAAAANSASATRILASGSSFAKECLRNSDQVIGRVCATSALYDPSEMRYERYNDCGNMTLAQAVLEQMERKKQQQARRRTPLDSSTNSSFSSPQPAMHHSPRADINMEDIAHSFATFASQAAVSSSSMDTAWDQPPERAATSLSMQGEALASSRSRGSLQQWVGPTSSPSSASSLLNSSRLLRFLHPELVRPQEEEEEANMTLVEALRLRQRVKNVNAAVTSSCPSARPGCATSCSDGHLCASV